jgi:hypothetical protein
MFVQRTGELDHHDLASSAQLRDRVAPIHGILPGSRNSARWDRRRNESRKITQIHGETRCRPGSSELAGGRVVAPATGQSRCAPRCENRERDPVVVAVAMRVGKIEKHLCPTRDRTGHTLQIRERLGRLWVPTLQTIAAGRQARAVRRPDRAQNCQQIISNLHIGDSAKRSTILADQRICRCFAPVAAIGSCAQHRLDDAHMRQTHNKRCVKHVLNQIQGQLEDLSVGVHTWVAVQLGAKLDRLTRAQRSTRRGMKKVSAISQPSHATPIEQMRIDPRRLGRDVSSNTHGSAGELIDQLEGAGLQITPHPGNQGVKIFQQRRLDELVAMAAKNVERHPTQLLELAGLGRQNIGNVIRKAPERHVATRIRFWRTKEKRLPAGAAVLDFPMKRPVNQTGTIGVAIR